MNVKCYLVDDTCYYVTALQDLVLKKFSGEKKNKFIKKVSYTSGKLGEPVKSPDANNYLAVIFPEGYKLEVKAEEKVEAEKVVKAFVSVLEAGPVPSTPEPVIPSNPATAQAEEELEEEEEEEEENEDPLSLSDLLRV